MPRFKVSDKSWLVRPVGCTSFKAADACRVVRESADAHDYVLERMLWCQRSVHASRLPEVWGLLDPIARLCCSSIRQMG